MRGVVFIKKHHLYLCLQSGLLPRQKSSFQEATEVPTLEPTPNADPSDGPTPTAYIPPTETLVPTPEAQQEPIVYHAQAGDTLAVVATHFGVGKDQIQSNEDLPESSFINPGTLLVIPQVLINTTSSVPPAA